MSAFQKLSVSVYSQPKSSLGSWRNGSRYDYKQILTFWHHFHWASRQLVVSSFFSFLLYENKFYVTTFYQDQCPMTMAPMCLPGLQSWEVPRKQTNFAFCIKSSPSASTLWKGQQSLIFITVLKSFPKKLKAACQRQSMSCQSKYVCRLHHECTPDYVRTYHAWPSAKWPSPQSVSFLYLRWMLREWNYVRG